MPLSPRIPLLVFVAALIAWTWDMSAYFPDHHLLKNANYSDSHTFPPSARRLKTAYARCTALKTIPGPHPHFAKREVSDRLEPGVNTSWLISNATLVLGRGNDTRWMLGDLYLDKGLIKAIGDNLDVASIQRRTVNLTVVNANRGWVTAGLVDIDSHLGVLSTPYTAGSLDFVPSKGPITPWLQMVDGLNTHDEAFQLAMAGGATSALIQSGGKNTLGSQAFVVKLRPTLEKSPTSMLVEPRFGQDNDNPKFWRHLVQACGETPSEYGTRPEAIWSLRAAYAEATNIMALQDAYCDKVDAGVRPEVIGAFPEDTRLELLVAVLRGNVKVSAKCQSAVDIDALVRLTNEFKFPVASLQHASEAWLVPHLLNRTYGGAPTASLFATNYRYDYPSYRGSEYAPWVLHDAGIPIALKSGHPTINARYLIQEAQFAHYFGLPPRLALAAVTSVPAKAIGLDHRIGILEEGADADVVLWDSNPLQSGAAPLKVWIDGQLQIPVPPRTGQHEVEIPFLKNGTKWEQFPSVPDWEKERNTAVEWDGLPPLTAQASIATAVVFQNLRAAHGSNDSNGLNVVVYRGRVACVGSAVTCALDSLVEAEVVDVKGGVLVPGMMSFGSPLGTEEISSEPSTGSRPSLDALLDVVPPIVNDPGALVYALDSLVFGTRNALLAHRGGVTSATVVAPLQGRLIAGVSATVSTSRLHAMQSGAIQQKYTALHVAIRRPDPLSGTGVGTNNQIAALRRLLLGRENQATDTAIWFKKAAEGIVPLVVEVEGVDLMAALLILKGDVENQLGSTIRMVFSGAAEAHVLAREIGRAHVGVILDVKPSIETWDSRRTLPGPPLTNETTLVALMKAGVKVGLKTREAQSVRNMGFDLRWTLLAANGAIDEDQAYALVTTNLRDLLGVTVEEEDLVVYAGGGPLDMSSKVVAVISPSRGVVEMW
ncbi:Amidohydro-3 domain-containing protein [Mycena chlorophos]|uniref:Amidohydro-3 domain-containing protein n=1 Tax=Mycena chlorophos TaxID=658473 RepID=A0A8H6S338_MYCCL|nr:Amidohydro-3 domain-containing protein [Mycena chlorophos]